MENLVTIATFSFVAEADANRLLLQQHGIDAFVADHNIIGFDWLLANAVGGVKLQVKSGDAARARQILDAQAATRTAKNVDATSGPIVFACQECGQTISFSVDRRGQVEVCPHCSEYVDVPEESELQHEPPSAIVNGDQPAPTHAVPSAIELTPRQIWLEVVAVLFLGFIPFLLSAIGSYWIPNSTTDKPYWYSESWRIVLDLQIIMPLLAIMALSTGSLASFGVTRPQWKRDSLLALGIWATNMVAYCMFSSWHSPFQLSEASSESLIGPHGLVDWSILFVACLVSGFMQEIVYRSYLITRLAGLFKSTFWAMLISTALFASFHLYQGVLGVFHATVTGVVYSLAFCWIRRVWPLSLAHAAHNFIVFTLIYRCH